MQFERDSCSEGDGVGIILYSPSKKAHEFSFYLNFSCANNIAKFEALCLGIE
jgi:hypothetical protein